MTGDAEYEGEAGDLTGDAEYVGDAGEAKLWPAVEVDGPAAPGDGERGDRGEFDGDGGGDTTGGSEDASRGTR